MTSGGETVLSIQHDKVVHEQAILSPFGVGQIQFELLQA
jgi:hypothetical protein